MLRYLSGAESAEAVCRRLQVCPQCLYEWSQLFMTHALRGLNAEVGGNARESVLAAEAADLEVGLREARAELEVWDRVSAEMSRAGRSHRP